MKELSKEGQEWLKGRVKYFQDELAKEKKYREGKIKELKAKVRAIKDKNAVIKKYTNIIKDLQELVGRSDWEV